MNQNLGQWPREQGGASPVEDQTGRSLREPMLESLPKRIIRSTFSRIGLGLFAMLMVQQIISLLLIVLIRTVAPSLEDTGWFLWAVSYIPLYGVSYPILLSIWRRVPNRMTLPYPTKKLPAYGYPLLIAGCFAVTYALNLVSILVAQGISMLTGSEIVNPLETALGSGNLWLNLIVVAIIAPVMEELIFRLFLYKKLACFGGRVYVFFSALLFAAFHINVYQMLYAFVLGVVMAVVTYQTGSIRYSILLHMCINFLGGGGTPLILHYGGEVGSLVMSILIVLILAAGIFAIVWWLRTGCPWMDFGDKRYDISPARMIVLNPGVLLYLLLAAVLTILQIVM